MKKHLNKIALICSMTLAINLFPVESVLAENITTNYEMEDTKTLTTELVEEEENIQELDQIELFKSKVTVKKPKVAVTGVSLDKTSTSIAKGNTTTLKAIVAPSNATNREVTWKSSNTNVATVDANGKVKGVKDGSATITVTTKDGAKKATCKVTVKNATLTVGKWVYPMNNYTVTQNFNNKYNNGKYHLGIDIKSSDKSIFAVADGVVTSAKNTGNNANGNCIVIEHTLSNGTKVYSAYAHLDSMSVKSGTKVTAGKKIGVMGNTGNSTGPHLHFTIFDIKSESPYGYGTSAAVNGVATYNGRKFYNPIKFIQNNGAVITDNDTTKPSVQTIAIGYVVTNGINLNVRKTASTTATILGKLSNGTKVEIVDKSISGWYKIKYNSGYGYVSKDYISLNNVATSTMKVSNNLITFIKKFEGFKSKPYKDAAGKLTIGYGHLIKSGEKFTSITESEATALLKKDISSFEKSVNSLCKGIKLTQNEFDSLVSFSFNLGAGTLQKSNLLSYIKSGGRDSSKIKNEYMKYVKANGVVLKGLQNRRYSEWRMFSYKDYTRYYKY